MFNRQVSTARTRSVLRTLIALAVVGLLPASAIWGADRKVRLAVVDFDTTAIHSSWSYPWSYENLQRAAADNLTNSLVQTGVFDVIERQQLDKVLAEQDLGDTSRIDPSTAAAIGKILGVQVIVIGSVKEFGVKRQDVGLGGLLKKQFRYKQVKGDASLTARLVDTTTARILGAYDASGSHTFRKVKIDYNDLGTAWDSGMASKVLNEAVEKLAGEIAAAGAQLVPDNPPAAAEGKLAAVEGSTVYLNLGSADLVEAGDRFNVKRVDKQILDPDTGAVLGGIERAIGVVQVTSIVNDHLSQATVIEGSGFQVGDKASKITD